MEFYAYHQALGEQKKSALVIMTTSFFLSFFLFEELLQQLISVNVNISILVYTSWAAAFLPKVPGGYCKTPYILYTPLRFYHNMLDRIWTGLLNDAGEHKNIFICITIIISISNVFDMILTWRPI